MTRERFSSLVNTVLTCSFEDCGCTEIIIVPTLSRIGDSLHYGECFEVVLYKNGVNIWRHFREDGKCHRHKRLGGLFAVTEKDKHNLSVTLKDGYIDVSVDGLGFSLRTDDIFDSFHIGFSAYEGYRASTTEIFTTLILR